MPVNNIGCPHSESTYVLQQPTFTNINYKLYINSSNILMYVELPVNSQYEISHNIVNEEFICQFQSYTHVNTISHNMSVISLWNYFIEFCIFCNYSSNKDLQNDRAVFDSRNDSFDTFTNYVQNYWQHKHSIFQSIFMNPYYTKNIYTNRKRLSIFVELSKT
jgi:hypothetical protein